MSEISFHRLYELPLQWQGDRSDDIARAARVAQLVAYVAQMIKACHGHGTRPWQYDLALLRGTGIRISFRVTGDGLFIVSEQRDQECLKPNQRCRSDDIGAVIKLLEDHVIPSLLYAGVSFTPIYSEGLEGPNGIVYKVGRRVRVGKLG